VLYVPCHAIAVTTGADALLVLVFI